MKIKAYRTRRKSRETFLFIHDFRFDFLTSGFSGRQLLNKQRTPGFKKKFSSRDIRVGEDGLDQYRKNFGKPKRIVIS